MAGEGIQVNSGFTINGPYGADQDFNWVSIAEANANIAPVRKYVGKPIYVDGSVNPTEKGLYFLADDLTTWSKYAADSALQYQGNFDPNVGAVPQVIDGTTDYPSGAVFVVSVAGFYNFTTGDQTPDAGGQNVDNLDVGDLMIYNPSLVWEVIENVALVESVNGKVGVVVLIAADLSYSNAGTDLTAVDVQNAITELDARDSTYLKDATENQLTGDTAFLLGTPGLTDIVAMGFEETPNQFVLQAFNSTFTAFSAIVLDSAGFVFDPGGGGYIKYTTEVSALIQADINSNIVPNRAYVSKYIGNQETNANVQTPTALEDTFALVWDDGAGEYKLGAAAAAVALEDRVMFDSNLDTVRTLFYNGVLTFGSFFIDAAKLATLRFETSTDGITWTDHGIITTSGTPPAALNSWITINGGSNWYLRLSVVYDSGQSASTGTQFTFTR